MAGQREKERDGEKRIGDRMWYVRGVVASEGNGSGVGGQYEKTAPLYTDLLCIVMFHHHKECCQKF